MSGMKVKDNASPGVWHHGAMKNYIVLKRYTKLRRYCKNNFSLASQLHITKRILENSAV